MHLAMECMKLEKTDLAFHCFQRSLLKCNHDPFLFNEIAVYYYKQGMQVLHSRINAVVCVLKQVYLLRYKEAREHLHTALKLANERQGRNSPIWEKIWCNLGHVYRQPP